MSLSHICSWMTVSLSIEFWVDSIFSQVINCRYYSTIIWHLLLLLKSQLCILLLFSISDLSFFPRLLLRASVYSAYDKLGFLVQDLRSEMNLENSQPVSFQIQCLPYLLITSSNSTRCVDIFTLSSSSFNIFHIFWLLVQHCRVFSWLFIFQFINFLCLIFKIGPWFFYLKLLFFTFRSPICGFLIPWLYF